MTKRNRSPDGKTQREMSRLHMEKTATIIFSTCKDRSAQDKWDENNLKTRLLVII